MGQKYARSVRLVLYALIAATAVKVSAQRGPETRSRWWRDPTVQRELKMTTTQVVRLEAIFNRDIPQRLALHEVIRDREADLLRLLRADNQATAMGVSVDLEELRRKQNTRRSLMLLEMYNTLTVEQRTRLGTIQGSRAPHRERGTKSEARSKNR